MAFSATGKVFGLSAPKTVTWERPGVVTGDVPAVRAIEEAARTTDEIGPVCGPYTTRDHLQSGLSTVFLILRVMPDAKFSGSVPKPPRVPRGAVV
jgi:hypothetical protein